MMRISSKANNSNSKWAPDWNRDLTKEHAKAGKQALDAQHSTPLGIHRLKQGDTAVQLRQVPGLNLTSSDKQAGQPEAVPLWGKCRTVTQFDSFLQN